MSIFTHTKTVAIIGASEDPKKIGNILLQKNQNFPGKLYAINPKGGSAYGRDFYQNIFDLPEIPDIAVFAIPAALVESSLEAAGKFGIKTAVIITAGFKEVGNSVGEQALYNIAKEYGMRILGPNCLGYGDTHKELNLSFGGQFFQPGNIGIISQSGAMAVAITDILESRQLGFSTFFSLGNKSDIDETDLFEELEQDPHTHVIALYLESITRGEDFMRALSRISSKKPIIIMLGGMSDRGKIATASHTGSLSGNRLVYEAAIKQGGGILTYSLEDFFNFLEIFSLSLGKKIYGSPYVITNAGGLGVLVTDQCEFHQVQMQHIDTDMDRILRIGMPTMMSTKNPIDIIGDADSVRVGQILQNLQKGTLSGDILLLFTVQATTDIDAIITTILSFSQNHPTYNIFLTLVGGKTIQSAQLMSRGARIFCTQSPESMIESYSHLLRFFGMMKEDSLGTSALKKLPVSQLQLLNENETESILNSYSIPTVHTKICSSEEEVQQYITQYAPPYILKVSGKHIAHKSDIGGVIGPVHTISEAHQAYGTLMDRLDALNFPRVISISQYIIPSPSLEFFCGAKRDASFGDIYIIGAGGIYLTLLDDTRIQIGKWTREDIQNRLASLRSFPALIGYRKQDKVDMNALVDCLLNLSNLFSEHSEINEIDINPILFQHGKPVIVDAKLYRS